MSDRAIDLKHHVVIDPMMIVPFDSNVDEHADSFIAHLQRQGHLPINILGHMAGLLCHGRNALARAGQARGSNPCALLHPRPTESCAVHPALAARHSALFLWVPCPMIFQADEVIAAWGFRYSGLAWTWVKFNPATRKLAFGPGYGTRKNCEPCLLARRSQPKMKARSVRDLSIAPARRPSAHRFHLIRQIKPRLLHMIRGSGVRFPPPLPIKSIT